MHIQGILNGLLVAIAAINVIAFFAFGVVSLREQARRAAWIAFSKGFFIATLYLAGLILPITVKWLLIVCAFVLLVVVGVLATLPIRLNDRPLARRQERFDERDVVFARARLQPGSEAFERYYAMRPENFTVDERIRALPGLLSLEARKAQPLVFAASQASFDLTESVREAVDGPVAAHRTTASDAEITAMIKGLAQHLGAHSVGITEVEPGHMYSHIGRGTGRYGAPIELEHRFAIAFSVEMDYAMMGTAPEAPVVMESARKYVDAAMIAIQLGNLCRRLGYDARAHIDGNYRVIAPLVARDAGLGDIGRMGILMTPGLGPRVRLGVVTTDLPMMIDPPFSESSIRDFCQICKKCADNCPSKAIPFGDEGGEAGHRRWKLDEIKCFQYWNVIGTDCGLCMTVCPYSHPDNWAHNLVRHFIRRSQVSRRIALWLDDLLYGREPQARPQPVWLPRIAH